MDSGIARALATWSALPWAAALCACSGDLLVGRTGDASVADGDAAAADGPQTEAVADAPGEGPGDAQSDIAGDAAADAGPMVCDLGSTGPCPSGQYCRFDDAATCVPATADAGPPGKGHCVARPRGCDAGTSATPEGGVCGCNYILYPDECAAHFNGAEVLGAADLCPSSPPNQPCTSRVGADCDAGTYCFFADIGCGTGIQGRCLPRTTDNPDGGPCPTTSPVCGCDINVYANVCFAHEAGVDRTLSSSGTCN